MQNEWVNDHIYLLCKHFSQLKMIGTPWNLKKFQPPAFFGEILVVAPPCGQGGEGGSMPRLYMKFLTVDFFINISKSTFYLCVITSNDNNFFSLHFFTHKVILFRNQHKISRRLVYNMTPSGGTAQATIFHALEGVSRANADAPDWGSKIFLISMVQLVIIKSQNNWAVIRTRKFPQRPY